MCSKLRGADCKTFVILCITYVISGILLLAAGITLKFILWKYDLFVSWRVGDFSVYVIALGSLVPLLPILAYYGYAKGIYFKIAFFISLIVILVLEMILAVEGFQIATHTYWVLAFRFPYGNSHNDEPVLKLWNVIQTEFQCCGRYHYEDWNDHLPSNKSGQYPLSCCKIPSDAFDFRCTKEMDIHRIGCIPPFGTYLTILTATAASVILISFIAQVATAIPLLKKCRFRCGCLCSEISYKSYDCNCKSIVFVSKDCSYRKHVAYSPNEECTALPSEPIIHETLHDVDK